MERLRRPIGNGAFAAPEDDRQILEPGGRASERASFANVPDVRAGGLESERAAPRERSGRAFLVLFALRLPDSQLVARPSRALIAEAFLDVADVVARGRPVG